MLQSLGIFLSILLKALVVIVPLLIAVLYLTLIERKVIAYMQGRIGPNRVGFYGLLQPIADAVKMFTKEIIIPSASNHYLFIIAPILAITPAIAAWAVVPFDLNWSVTDINAGVLYLFAMGSLAVYAVLIAGWASNSKYSFLGALRAAAQTISYEIGMGFCFVGVLLAAGSLNLKDIVLHQQGGIWHWYILPLFPLFVVYWISAVAETNRAPFDVAEGEAELVAGFHVEYSGIAFGLFFLAEYLNMILVSAIATLLFLGGWLSPLEGIAKLGNLPIPGIIWFGLKVALFLFLMLWLRATFPRYRYDQIMRLGWKILIPVTLVWVVLVALAVQYGLPPWFQNIEVSS